MEYCNNCLALVRAESGVCSGCGKPVERHEPPRREQGAPSAPPVTPIETWLLASLRWIRLILIIVSVGAISAAFIGSLVEQSRAAQASSFVQAQLGRRHYERKEQLRQALASLESLYDELVRSAADGAPMTARERERWRLQLKRVRQRYMLDGQASFGRDHPRAEGALRNATLYLSSLERSGSVGQHGRPAELERSIRQSFLDAKTDLGR